MRVGEGAALGAALRAGMSEGRFVTENERSSIVEMVGEVAPDKAGSVAYEEYYESYRKLYPALQGNF